MINTDSFSIPKTHYETVLFTFFATPQYLLWSGYFGQCPQSYRYPGIHSTGNFFCLRLWIWCDCPALLLFKLFTLSTMHSMWVCGLLVAPTRNNQDWHYVTAPGLANIYITMLQSYDYDDSRSTATCDETSTRLEEEPKYLE